MTYAHEIVKESFEDLSGEQSNPVPSHVLKFERAYEPVPLEDRKPQTTIRDKSRDKIQAEKRALKDCERNFRIARVERLRAWDEHVKKTNKFVRSRIKVLRADKN